MLALGPLAVMVAGYVALAVTVLPAGGPAHAHRVELLLTLVTCSAAACCWTVVPRRRGERSAWSGLAAGLSGYGGGFAVLFYVPGQRGLGPFGLNLSDGFSLLLYPCAYVGLLLLTRARVHRISAAALLDGAVVGLTTAALAVGWAASSYPSLLHGGVLDVVYALAYPVGGATLLAVTLTGLSVAGWRLDRSWVLLVAGFALMTVGDASYGMQSVARSFRFGTSVDLLYTAGPVLVALAAAWGPERQQAGSAAQLGSLSFAVPGLATLTAVGVLVADHVRPIPAGAVALAAAAASLAVARTALLLGQERQLVTSRREARTDPLTGLANRRALLDEIDNRLNGSGSTLLALIDLDAFKAVNDTLGHAVGDTLLSTVAVRLAGSVPGLVARLGGDEFAVVAEGSLAHGRDLAATVRAAVEPVMLVDGCVVTVTASVGLAVLRSDDRQRTAGELLRRADVALYRAKELRTGVEPWDPLLDAGARDRLQLVTELRAALASEDQIVAFLQPTVEPRTLQVLGYEALVRWEHPRRGLLGPGEFLETAERAGLLPAITATVLERALRHARALRDSGHPVAVAVNVGAPDLLDLDFPATVTRLLTAHRLPAAALRVEITETVVMSDPVRIDQTLRDLRRLGIGLSLDDYGTGLSSLAHLRTLPVDTLKIDRSFVRHLTTDTASLLIVDSTIELAHGLGLRVIAEGVEDAATLLVLATSGCDAVQGYFTGRPAAGPLARLPAPRGEGGTEVVPVGQRVASASER